MSASTGAVVPARCGRLSCSYCVRIAASRRAAALALARPERAVLLTRAGTDWSTVRPRLNRVRYDVARATGKPFEWAYHVEPNPSGDGQHHVHAWTHGAFVPQALLSEIADRRGFGTFARINRVRSGRGSAQYGLKGLGYGLKGVAAEDSAREYLRANGKRLTHQSRGFFRDARGEGLPVREAERLAMESQRTDPGPWTLIAL